MQLIIIKGAVHLDERYGLVGVKLEVPRNVFVFVQKGVAALYIVNVGQVYTESST
jgi:hypothetical protein